VLTRSLKQFFSIVSSHQCGNNYCYYHICCHSSSWDFICRTTNSNGIEYDLSADKF